MDNYSVINKFNYYLFGVLFNLLNVVLVGMMYESGWFGAVTVSFETLVIDFFSETLFNRIDLILLIGAIVVAIIEGYHLKKNKRDKEISFNKKTFKKIFIPVIAVLVAGVVYLYTVYVDSGWLIAFGLVILNMVIFNFVYVLWLYKYCDKLVKHR